MLCKEGMKRTIQRICGREHDEGKCLAEKGECVGVGLGVH